MSCGVGCRPGSDPVLLWLWCRPEAIAPIGLLAWEPPYAAGAALRTQKREKKKKGKWMPPLTAQEAWDGWWMDGWMDGCQMVAGGCFHVAATGKREVCGDHSPQRLCISLQLEGQWIDPKQDQELERIMTAPSNSPKLIWIKMHKHPPVLTRCDLHRG